MPADIKILGEEGSSGAPDDETPLQVCRWCWRICFGCVGWGQGGCALVVACVDSLQASKGTVRPELPRVAAALP